LALGQRVKRPARLARARSPFAKRLAEVKGNVGRVSRASLQVLMQTLPPRMQEQLRKPT
jgi:hypothetical protein